MTELRLSDPAWRTDEWRYYRLLDNVYNTCTDKNGSFSNTVAAESTVIVSVGVKVERLTESSHVLYPIDSPAEIGQEIRVHAATSQYHFA